MWPWEHLAFGYLLYSSSVRLRGTGPPGDVAVVLLVLATQLPDLVDKPLAWALGVLPHGLSLAHSLLFAVPVLGLVALLARRRGSPEYGVAVAVGYLSHLVGDSVYWVSRGGGVALDFLLWPLVRREPEPAVGLWTRVAELFDTFLAFLTSPAGQGYLLLEATLLALVFGLWVLDGTPGLFRHRLAGEPGSTESAR